MRMTSFVDSDCEQIMITTTTTHLVIPRGPLFYGHMAEVLRCNY